MRTKLFFARKAVLAACVLCFVGVNAEKIADPGGLEWVIMDAETEGAIPYVPEAEGDFIVKMSPWASQVVSIVDNPYEDVFYNPSEKCVLWVKENVDGEGDWGSVSCDLNNGEDWWDLSVWDAVSVDLAADKPLAQYKIGLYDRDSNSEIANVEVWDVNGTAKTWYRFSMPLETLKQNGTLTADTKIFKIIVFVNGGSTEKTNVYVDNIKFTRTTEPGGGSGVREVDAKSLCIYPTPATESISLTGVQGRVSIYTLSGMEVYAAEAYTGEQIAVDNLASGIYLVKVGDVCAKFVKE